METFFLVAGMMLVTFSIRYILLPLSGRIRFSDSMQRALGYVPPAVLTAIIVPAALIPDGQTLSISWTNPYCVGAVITTLIGYFSKNLLITIVGGMAAFALWQWVLMQI
ncbi:MAG: AzlD domain-containing protein [Desulfobacteraceae bacterium]|jgi:branched-subunit amino acid transport protein